MYGLNRMVQMVCMARQSMGFLRGTFPGHLISQFGNIPWTACSLDFAVPDFFLRGCLKSNVYPTFPHTIQELKDSIMEGIGRNNGALLQQVTQIFRQRLWQCINVMEIIWNK
jgi:hypothetical protein